MNLSATAPRTPARRRRGRILGPLAILGVMLAVGGLGVRNQGIAYADGAFVQSPVADDEGIVVEQPQGEPIDWDAIDQELDEQPIVGARDDGEGNLVADTVVGGFEIDAPSWYVHTGNCGGTLVAPQWVVTAEHCGPKVGTFVTIGGFELRRGVQYWDIRSDPGLNEDIALIKLDRPSSLTPLPMSVDRADNDAGKPVYSIGLGATCVGCDNPTARQVKTTGWMTIDGDAPYQNSFLYGDPGLTTCYGDSGGPVVGRNAQGRQVLIGIVSYTRLPACENIAGAAKVPENLRWIQDRINANGGPGSTAAPRPNDPLPEGTFRLAVNGQRGECLGIEGNSLERFAYVETAPCDGRPSQNLTIDGRRIRFTHSNLCLDLIAASTNDGQQMVQWGCWNFPNQQVFADGAQILMGHSEKCFDGAGRNGSERVVQWQCDGSENQQWTVVPLLGTDSLPTLDGFSLQVTGTDRCLDIRDSSTERFADLITTTCDGRSSQQLSIDGRRIRFAHSGLCADLIGASFNPGQRLVQWTCRDDVNQKVARSGNTFQLAHSAQCLDATQRNGAVTVIQSTCSNAAGQQWTVLGPNDPPVIDGWQTPNGVVGVSLSGALLANDPDGDELVYRIEGLPDGVAVDSTTGIFFGVPTEEGDFALTASVSDGRTTVTAEDSLTVTAANVPPGPAGDALDAPCVAQRTGQSVVLTWDPIDGEDDSYQVRRNGRWAALVTIDAQRRWTDGNAAPGTTWEIRSREAGRSTDVPCTEVVADREGDGVVGGDAPCAAIRQGNTVTLTWLPIDGENDSYEVRRNGRWITTVAIDRDRTWTDQSAPAGASYVIRSREVGRATDVDCTIGDGQAAAPTCRVVVTGNQATLSWDAIPGENDTYQIRRNGRWVAGVAFDAERVWTGANATGDVWSIRSREFGTNTDIDCT